MPYEYQTLQDRREIAAAKTTIAQNKLLELLEGISDMEKRCEYHCAVLNLMAHAREEGKLTSIAGRKKYGGQEEEEAAA